MSKVDFASGTMLPSSCSMMDDDCGMAVWMIREAGCRWLREKSKGFVFTTLGSWFKRVYVMWSDKQENCIL